MKWDSTYNINFKKLALLLLPTMFRRDILGELAKILVTPVAGVHAELLNFRRECDFRLTHNGQRCYLRGCLNEIYDPIDRRIEIGEAEEKSTSLIFERNDPDNRVAIIPGGGYFVINERGFAGGLDFTVKVPENIRVYIQ